MDPGFEKERFVVGLETDKRGVMEPGFAEIEVEDKFKSEEEDEEEDEVGAIGIEVTELVVKR